MAQMSTACGSIRPAEDLSRLERQLTLSVWNNINCCCCCCCFCRCDDDDDDVVVG